MDALTAELMRRIADVARRVPRPLLEHFSDLLEALPLNPTRNQTGTVLQHVTQPSARQSLLSLIGFWRRKVPDVRPDQLAWAIRAAALADEERVRSQSVELVWTGPTTVNSTFRRTEQGLLELINSAEHSLILMTFAAYKVPQISDALLEAARRGVEVSFIAESPVAQGGKVSFAGFQALGEPLNQKAKLYIWPKEKRLTNTLGKYGSLHAKCAVADNSSVFITSANLTGYALNLNMEMGVLIRGGELPLQVAAHLNSLITDKTLQRVLL